MAEGSGRRFRRRRGALAAARSAFAALFARREPRLLAGGVSRNLKGHVIAVGFRASGPGCRRPRIAGSAPRGFATQGDCAIRATFARRTISLRRRRSRGRPGALRDSRFGPIRARFRSRHRHGFPRSFSAWNCWTVLPHKCDPAISRTARRSAGVFKPDPGRDEAAVRRGAFDVDVPDVLLSRARLTRQEPHRTMSSPRIGVSRLSSLGSEPSWPKASR